MQPKLRLVLHRQIPEDETFAEQWNQLVFVMERPEVFYTYEWALAVSRAYKSGRNPLVFAGHRGDALAGIAAMAAGSEGDQVSFLTGATADYCDFVSAPDDRSEFVQLVIEELRRMGFSELCFANVPSDSITAGAIAATLRASNYSVFTRPAYECARVLLNTPEDRAQTAKSALRKSPKTRTGEHGRVEIMVSHESGWDEVDTEFADFVLAHVGRFLGAGKISNLVYSERRVFLLQLAKLLSVRGWLRLSTLKAGGRTIAWNYGFRFAGSWFWYQPAFDHEHQHLSPGRYLLCEILREASADQEIRTVDLGLGDEGYKQRYAPNTRQTLYIAASRSTVRLAREVCRYRVAELVKRSPRLESAVRKGVSRAAKFRVNAAQRGYGASFFAALRRSGPIEEVFFFEWAGKELSGCAPAVAASDHVEAVNVQPISAKLLASAAIKYAHDEETLNYLLRSATRLRSRVDGFALISSSGEPVHFCWVAPFEGFKMSELRHVLREPAAGSVLLFDCWTPESGRRRGYYGLCASQVATRLRASGKRPWIFSAAANLPSVHALERAGFVQRFSLTRKKKLFLSRISMSPKYWADPMLDFNPAA
jgi:CelD/BcsL family acetyltransferase involved in cellulose biosynthesis